MRVRFRQVGLADADVDDLDAQRVHLRLQRRANALHQGRALSGDDVWLRDLAEFAAKRCGETQAKLLLAVPARGAEILQRVLDPPARDGVDVQALLVGSDNFGGVEVVALIALLIEANVVDQRNLQVKARAVVRQLALFGRVDRVLRRADADHDRLLVDRHDVESVGEDHQRDGCDNPADHKGALLHDYCPVVGAGWRPRSTSSGMTGTAPDLLSRMTLSVRPSTVSIISRNMRSRVTRGAARYSA